MGDKLRKCNGLTLQNTNDLTFRNQFGQTYCWIVYYWISLMQFFKPQQKKTFWLTKEERTDQKLDIWAALLLVSYSVRTKYHTCTKPVQIHNYLLRLNSLYRSIKCQYIISVSKDIHWCHKHESWPVLRHGHFIVYTSFLLPSHFIAPIGKLFFCGKFGLSHW